MFLLCAAALFVVLGILIRVAFRDDDVLVVFGRMLLWAAVILAALTLFTGAASAQTLTVSPQAVLSAFPESVPAESTKPTRPPRWATAVAVAGPLADGLSTCYALAQSGPQARVMEGNGFHRWLFRGEVTCGKMLGFKSIQALLLGAGVHYASRDRAIGSALLQGVVHGVVSAINLRQAAKAKRLNGGMR